MAIKSSDMLVCDAKSQCASVTIEELKNLISAKLVEVIDVRDGTERQSKPYIPGSHHADRGMLEFYIDPNSEFHRPVFSSPKKFVFVCGSGGRASLAAKTAHDMGLTNVAYLEGGMKNWIASGQETKNE